MKEIDDNNSNNNDTLYWCLQRQLLIDWLSCSSWRQGGLTLEKMLPVSGCDEWVNQYVKSFYWSNPSSTVLHVPLDPHTPLKDQRGWSSAEL